MARSTNLDESDEQHANHDTGTDADGGVDRSITIRDLTKTFDGGNVVACEDVSLDIHDDEFVVLLGPSGCGKTTTLRCLAGLEQPDEGTITIGDRDVTHAKPKDRDLAFVFQDIALFPHMSVRENIRFGLDMKTELPDAEKQERIEETAEILGIEELLDRKPAALSGGQQQRVSLGRAMVMEPAAFLLDEPFSALDANLRDQMRVEVKKLQRQLQRAMVFVTHDQEEAMTLGDKIVVLDNARIQQVGTPHDIYNDPANRFVAEFIGSPSTNFLPCSTEGVADGLRVETSLFEATLRGADAAVETADAAFAVRPEYLSVTDAGEGVFDAEVALIEPHGSQDAVHLVADGVELTAETDQGVVDRREDTVGVDVALDEAWVFDAAGDRIV